MKIIIIGSNGMLGIMLTKVLKNKGHHVLTVARNNADLQVDLLKNLDLVITYIQNEQPDIVINTAANIDLQQCEQSPGYAYLINGRVPAIFAEICHRLAIYFIQISTDHYYTGENDKQHIETEHIHLLNEYARTKYIGEILAGIHNEILIVRTNIIGFKGDRQALTFIEWVLRSLEREQVINGFSDYYTSSIDVEHFSELLHELMLQKITGVVNIGSKDVLSKYDFILKIARGLGKEHLVNKATIESLNVNIKRAESLGLDVSKLASFVGQSKIPSSKDVVEWVLQKYKEGALSGIFNDN